MKFKSIQFSVAALAGAIVLSVVAALVLYALFSGARTQDDGAGADPGAVRASHRARLTSWRRPGSARSSANSKRRC